MGQPDGGDDGLFDLAAPGVIVVEGLQDGDVVRLELGRGLQHLDGLLLRILLAVERCGLGVEAGGLVVATVALRQCGQALVIERLVG